MSSIHHKFRMVGVFAVFIALSIVSMSFCATLGTDYPSKRMADGKQWTTSNLNIDSVPSYCYENSEKNCRRYGRLYT